MNIWIYAVIWFVAYTSISVIASKQLSIPSNVNITGPILTIRSQYGLSKVKQIANRYSGFWNYWGYAGFISAILTAVIALVFLGISAYSLLTQPQAIGIQGPTDMLVIPGVNRFLPLSAAPEIVLGLLVAMIIHEGGHAIYCRTGDIEIKSTGVILAALIPLGAFVEPDEEEQLEADVISQLKMYSAGIMNNYALYLVSILTFFVITTFVIAPVTGAGIGAVLTNSPAEDAGIQDGDVIVSANGQDVQTANDLVNISNNASISNVTLRDNTQYQIPNGSYITTAPRVSNLEPTETVVKIDNMTVRNQRDIENIMSNASDPTAKFELKNGFQIDVPVGAYISVKKDGSFSRQLNLDVGDSAYITSINGEKVYNKDSLDTAIQDNEDSVSITYIADDNNAQNTTVNVSALKSDILVSQNPSGIVGSDLGINFYPKDAYYGQITFGDSVIETLQNMLRSIILPLGSIAPGVKFGLPGFTPFIQNFYTIQIGSKLISSSIFFIAGLLYWTSWININLAIFNCIPTFALDGGHVLRAIVEQVTGSLGDTSQKYLIMLLKGIFLLPILIMFIVPIFVA